MSDQLYEELKRAVMELDTSGASAAAKKIVEEGGDPVAVISRSIRPGLEAMGEKYATGQAFLPELMLAAQAAEAAVAAIEPELLRRGAARPANARVLLATVKGDIHDIGKNIVALLLKSAGFEVVDMGVDKEGSAILQKAEEVRSDIIGLSAVLTTTMPRMKEIIDVLVESGKREKYKVIIGGAPVNQAFADQIGADGYGPDAARAVELVRKLTA
ncbi:MAG: cobalamin-dependent protein [Deltaproteobacteria bacterium]|nr:cobalamin-dependent protein [Deltaproteobacteria bacterium]MBW2308374.1 cobalamin-dependent protein [Deltaproteobacteria bacterium]